MRLLAILTCAALMMPATAFAQAGSTGGSIGKKDKSISGGEEPRSSTPAPGGGQAANRKSDQAETLPKVIHLIEHAYGGAINYTVTLRNVGGRSYQGTWSHGYVTNFTVTAFSKDSISMERRDNPAFGAVTGTYTGSRIANRATGESTISNGGTPKWEASW